MVRMQRDGFRRWAQLAGGPGVRLVRLVAGGAANVYTAEVVEFAPGGATRLAGEPPAVVTNLAEPADQPGQLPSGIEAVALDVEGRWVVFVRPGADGGGAVLARVVAALGGAEYAVVEQQPDPFGGFQDRAGAAAFSAHNLAELSLGPGAAVDVDARVLVTAATGGSPPVTRYVFDHPVYAKYLD